MIQRRWISILESHKPQTTKSCLLSCCHLLTACWLHRSGWNVQNLLAFRQTWQETPSLTAKLSVLYIYIYVVYIHTRNVYYICTYYECICYIYYIAYIMCIYIYTLWLYNMCESIKTDRAADHLWIPKWQISARHRRFWMTRYCWVRSAKSCWEFHSNARAKSQRLSRNYPSIYYIVIL